MLRATPSPSAVRVALVAASTLLAAATEASGDAVARLALGEEDLWVFDDGFRFREKSSVGSGLGSSSASEMERLLAGDCERPKVTCEQHFDKQGMRFCHMPDIKPSCLKPTSSGYMHFPISADWPDLIDGANSGDNANGKDKFTNHLKICRDSCSSYDWCNGFSLHKTMDTCHLLDLSASRCTLKSYARCGPRNNSKLHEGWDTYIAKQADGAFSPWSRCKMDKDHIGRQTRKCDNPRPALGGMNCTGPYERVCSGEGDDGGWSKWGPCSATCGEGTQRRTCVDASKDCSGDTTRKCPGLVDCPEWSNWTPCSVSCGPGVRKRDCRHGPGCVGNDTEVCNNGECPIHGGWSPWGKCIDGIKRRTCTNPAPKSGGAYCVGDEEQECGVWGPFRECSTTCGPGVKTRPCLVKGEPGDPSLCCGGATNSSKPCLTRVCPHWGPWSECSKTCGNGTQVRACVGGGGSPLPCGGGPVARACEGLHECDKGSWGPWSECTATCGKGVRTRECVGGDRCEGLNVRPCAGLAKCSGWGFWSECSQTCNSEKSVGFKRRKCVRSDDMYECKGSAKVQCSRLPPCPVDGGYSDWSGCSRSCGHGVESRTCTNPEPKYGGANCSTLGDSQRPCLGGVCPADGGFGAWGQCDASCGVGVRKRECDDPKPEFGGKACDGLALEICVTRTCHSDIAGNTFYIATDADATEFLDFETGGAPLTAADSGPPQPDTDTSSANTTVSTKPTVAELTGPAAAAVGGLAAGPVASGSLIQLREGARRSASGGSLVALPERYAGGISRLAESKTTTTPIVYSDDENEQPHPRRSRPPPVYTTNSPGEDEEMHVFEGEAARTSRASATATTRRGASAHAPGRFRAVHIVEAEPNKNNNNGKDGNHHQSSESAAAAAAGGAGSGSARHSISRYLMQVATGALPREPSSESSSSPYALAGGHHSVRIDPGNATATSSSSTSRSADQALEAAMRNESSQAPVLSPLDPATHVIFTVRKSASSRANAISAPAFRLEKLTPDGFSYLIALAADCPADHSTVDLGCKAYLGMDGGHLVLTDEVEKRVVAMEAGQDGVFLRFGGAGGEGKWVNVDDDGIYLSPMFSGQEHWFLKPKIQPVDGGWSAWGPCVRGFKNRNCTNPSPMYDGKPCVGDAQVQCCDEACKGAAAASVIGPHLKNLNNQTDSDSTEDHPRDALAPAWPSASDSTAAPDSNLTGDANTTDTTDNAGGPSPLDIITGDYLQHPLNATQTSPEEEEGGSHVQISSNCLVDLGLFDYSQGLGLDYEDIVSRLKLKILTESDKVTPEAAERRARQLLETSC